MEEKSKKQEPMPSAEALEANGAPMSEGIEENGAPMSAITETDGAPMSEAVNEEENATAAEEEAAVPELSAADRVRIISPLRLVLKRFFRSKLSVIGLTMFVVLLLFSFVGPLFVGWSEGEVDASGTGISYSYRRMEGIRDDEGNSYTIYADDIVKSDINNHAMPFSWSHEENARLHVLGTDKNGHDIFAYLMYGGRLSLTLSFLVVIIYSLIGIVLGGLAGYFGKWVDMIIMRIVDILSCIPSLPILLILGAILESLKVDQNLRIYYMMGFLALLSWTGVARLVRGQILFLREQEYIVAAEALGLSPLRKIFRHLVPNVMPQLIVSMTLGLGSMILYEATLSFLGLGVPPDAASWGQMVQSAVGDTAILNYYVECWLPAGIMIILAVLAFNFIGDGLRDALDPKMKR